jgi:hypothetical protein
MKFRLFLIFILFFQIVISQEKVLSIPVQENIKETISIVDEKSQNIAILNFDKNHITGKLYDKDFKNLGTVKAKKLPGKYISFIGHQFNGDQLTVLMNTANNRSYAITKFDFKAGSNRTTEVNFKLKRETYLSSFSRDNIIFMATASNKGSQLNIYEFSKNFNEPKKTEIQIPENSFTDRFDDPVDFHNAIASTRRNGEITPPVTLKENLPAIIEKTSKPLKIFPTPNGFSLTIDTWLKHTYLMKVSLKKNKAEVFRFEYPKPNGFVSRTEANSFLHHNKLFQVVMGGEEMLFSVFSVEGQLLEQQIILKRDEEINFKNTPVVQKGGSFEDFRVLDNSNQFFRKTLDAEIGLSVTKNNGLYEVTFGSVKEFQDPMAYYFAAGGLIGGAVGMLTTTFIEYRNTKSVQFTGLFSEGFNHENGKVKPNIFDRIAIFTEDFNLRSETLFFLNYNYYYGYFNKDESAYIVYKFSPK